MASVSSFSGLASGIQWRDLVEQIVQAETARKLGPLVRQSDLQSRRADAWKTFGGHLSRLSAAAKKLEDGSAFDIHRTTAGKTASGKSVVSATASATASPGSYRVEVVQLAGAEKTGSGVVASATEALGTTGEFWINGGRVEVAAGDTLNDVRDRINALNTGAGATGVGATVLATGAGAFRLVLSAEQTGSRGIELVDGDGAGNVLEQLGVVTGTATRNASVTDPARTESLRVASKSGSLKSVLGLSAPPAKTTVSFGGVKVEVDLENDTVLTLMNRINDVQAGKASVVEEQVGGKTQYRLSVAGAVEADAAASDPAASQRIVELMGFVRAGRGNEIAAGRDAVFRVDGYRAVRRANVVGDVIEGVTLNLLEANGSERTSTLAGAGLSMVADPRTIDAGSYAIALTASSTTRTATPDSPTLAVAADPGVADGVYAVTLATTTTRSTGASTASLSVAAAPGTVAAGTYAVNVTQAATRATALGSVVAGTYGTGGDGMTVVDNVTGIARTYTLTAGQDLDSVVAGLNAMFTGNGMSMSATNDGGRLKLQHSTHGSASDFLVTTSHARVSTHFGIGGTGGTSYNGVDVAGTIGGQAATGVGQSLTAGGSLAGLRVAYTGSAAGAVGDVTVTDTTAVSGGTIGGQAAAWDAGTGRLTVGSGALAGLSVAYSGPATDGAVGSVTVATTGTAAVTGVTIDGEAAVWDEATRTIRGATGSRFEGLELGFTGPAATGSIGSLTVAGEIGADLRVDRDLDATVKKGQELAGAFNAVVGFANGQRVSGMPLNANGSLRTALASVKDILLSPVAGLDPAATAYTRTAIAGVMLTKDGTLEVDETTLRGALTTDRDQVKALFGTNGTTTSSQVDYLSSTADTTPGSYAVRITRAATVAAATGSPWAGSYDGSGPDTMRVLDAYTGKSIDVALTAGIGIDGVLARLNDQFEAGGMSLTARKSAGGELVIEGTRYGSAASFTVSYLSGGTDFAGAAPTGLAAGSYAGMDVEGTIGGAAATGQGQLLTADAETDAAGLTVQFTGDAPLADAGRVTFVAGAAGMLDRLLEGYTRAGTGILAGNVSALEKSVESLTRRQTDAETRIERYQERLVAQFIAMEVAMSRVQSQGDWLNGQISAMQTFNMAAAQG